MHQHIGHACSKCDSTLNSEDDVIECPECLHPYHVKCWDESERCSWVACSGRSKGTAAQVIEYKRQEFMRMEDKRMKQEEEKRIRSIETATSIDGIYLQGKVTSKLISKNPTSVVVSVKAIFRNSTNSSEKIFLVFQAVDKDGFEVTIARLHGIINAEETKIFTTQECIGLTIYNMISEWRLQ